MNIFDRKFGASFLAGIPARPGVYRLYDADGALLYVGKAGNLRRRLGQYRAARRTKRDRKRRALVRGASRIDWEVVDSELDASLREVRLIQTLVPRDNVASAFSFLYPYIGVRADGGDAYFCLTTSPDAFPGFALHGAYRSRDLTGEAFFALRRLLAFVGHPVSRARSARLVSAPHSHVFGVRRLPADWPAMWARLLRGESREALEILAFRLLDHAGARARRVMVHEQLRALGRFAREEAGELARAIAATGYSTYPVPQRDRDPLFLEARHRAAASRERPR